MIERVIMENEMELGITAIIITWKKIMNKKAIGIRIATIINPTTDINAINAIISVVIPAPAGDGSSSGLLEKYYIM
ncbi:MAG: hypothetical protein EZS28_041234 [Streblomastix strix]|uniref:Uncharacterized protein n=1 Tax=Streblomastix strix TaxID=222440 RepID=A0A5J4TYV3_9EUKA|nr:MAG: hypothetical protein EZS28_041234 [Streblomastix strix]